MTEQKNSLAQLFAARGKNEASKAGFLADPKAVLAEYDMPVPDNLDVKVVENADDCVKITLPAPPVGDMDLSDEELSNAAGGVLRTGSPAGGICHAQHQFAHVTRLVTPRSVILLPTYRLLTDFPSG